ncbi:hypothetical protein COV53_01680 [Candidatus Gottesmanbacteria bacterium CG11_big_fil_rev_8_21_14_0_20_37_11]|uniref:Uncharacterized protein n=2 Tax=Candidatus Gottesmaniibacteriota TaxID=1752720 RepID=A0A2M7RR15_9BACT|nr:MAG: hypothetical protein COV53_01680 [Candidatus Gottesmanbacteria bacterium CG11_big_fil_rev_8_21_14_0_20_37_11]PIZ02748.1 MAG: hypothetical protein COY59_03130 [Candidatus Gottesmanbacteria bacterium CG_4_10_14_0_8_um_filter_37_24]
MTMTHKNKSRILPIILFLAVVTILAVVFTPRLINQSKIVQSLQGNAKDKQVAELLEAMNAKPNKESEEYKALRQKFCLLTARPEAERAKAITNIKEFLHGIYPLESGDFQVEFLCSRFNGKPDDSGTDYNNPASEYYEAKNHSFEIDPKTNYILGVGDAERTKRTDPLPDYDYSGRYSKPEELRQVAEKFLTEYKDILGIDLTKMTYEFEGTKPGNFFMHWEDKSISVTKEHEVCGDVDQKREGAYKNAQGVWCIKMKSTNYQRIDITITNGGQIIIYRNNINDLDKL